MTAQIGYHGTMFNSPIFWLGMVVIAAAVYFALTNDTQVLLEAFSKPVR